MNAQALAELWEPLAARCPELRPDAGGLTFARKGAPVFEPKYGDSVPSENDTYERHDGAVDEAIAAALWRDAAVRWLASHGSCHAVTILGGWVITPDAKGPSGYCVNVNGLDSNTSSRSERVTGDYDGPTLDHALAAAVLAVLDAVATAAGGTDAKA